MKKISGLVLSLLITAGLLISCGQQGVSNTGSNAAPGAGTSSATPAAATPEVSVQATEPAQETEPPEAAFPRTYVDIAGREVTIEKEPQKIAVTYLPYWEYLLSLGVSPVAASNAEHYSSTWDPFLDKDYGADKVIDIGAQEVNFEMLLEIAPDLIIIPTPDGLEEFEKIAPTIVMDGKFGLDWRLGLRELAKVVGKEEAAEEKITETEEKLAEYKVKLDEKYQNETVSIVCLMGENRYYCAKRPVFYDKETGLGLNAPEGYPDVNNYEQVTLEAIAGMNPDYIFLVSFDGSEALVESLKSNTVWASLNAVKKNQVYLLDGSAHSTSSMSTEYTADKIVEYLIQ